MKRWRVTKLEGKSSRKRDLVAEVEVSSPYFHIFYPASDSVMHSFHVEDIVSHGLQVPDLIYLDVSTVSGIKTLTLRTTTSNSKDILAAVTKLRQDASESGSVDVVLLRGWLDKRRSRFPRYCQRRFCVIKQCQRSAGLHDLIFEYFDSHPSTDSRKKRQPLGWVDIAASNEPPVCTRNELTIYGMQVNKSRERSYTFVCDGRAAAALWKASISFGVASIADLMKDQMDNSPATAPSASSGSSTPSRTGGSSPADRNKNMDVNSPAMGRRKSSHVGLGVNGLSAASASSSATTETGKAVGGSRRRKTTLTMNQSMDDPSTSDALDDIDPMHLAGRGGGDKQTADGMQGRDGDVCGPTRYTYEYCIKPGFDPIDKGYRKECQDSACLIEEFGSRSGGGPAAFIGVFDGHGQNGRKVSSFVKREFPNMIARHASYPKKMEKVFDDCSTEIEELLKEQSFDVRLSGTTASYVVLDDDWAKVGWCGDSRAVLGKFDAETGTYKAVDLTHDHKPTDDEEKARIESCGGMVMKVSDDVNDDDGIPARVFDAQRPHFGPGIAMSRSLGDTNATALGVIPTPQYTCHSICNDDGFMIFASDGLWEVFTSEEAVRWVTDYVKQMEEKGIVPGQTHETDHLIVSQNLAEEAQRRWVVRFNAQEVVDDTTVIIIFINLMSQYTNRQRGKRSSIVQDFSSVELRPV